MTEGVTYGLLAKQSSLAEASNPRLWCEKQMHMASANPAPNRPDQHAVWALSACQVLPRYSVSKGIEKVFLFE